MKVEIEFVEENIEMYREEEVDAIKVYYMDLLNKEREKNYHLTQAVHHLTDQFNQKNNLEQKLNKYLDELRIVASKNLIETTKG